MSGVMRRSRGLHQQPSLPSRLVSRTHHDIGSTDTAKRDVGRDELAHGALADVDVEAAICQSPNQPLLIRAALPRTLRGKGERSGRPLCVRDGTERDG